MDILEYYSRAMLVCEGASRGVVLSQISFRMHIMNHTELD